MTEDRLPDIELQIPPRPEYVGVVRHLMGAVARLGEHPPEFADNAKLAGSEAVTNAVTSSGRSGTNESVNVQATLEEGRLHISVADHGAGEGPGPQPLHTVESEDMPFDQELSLPLLQGLVDELEVVLAEDGGTVVRMTLIGEEAPPEQSE